MSFHINASNSALLPTRVWGWTASVSDCQKNEAQILLSFFLQHGLSPKTEQVALGNSELHVGGTCHIFKSHLDTRQAQEIFKAI